MEIPYGRNTRRHGRLNDVIINDRKFVRKLENYRNLDKKLQRYIKEYIHAMDKKPVEQPDPFKKEKISSIKFMFAKLATETKVAMKKAYPIETPRSESEMKHLGELINSLLKAKTQDDIFVAVRLYQKRYETPITQGITNTVGGMEVAPQMYIFDGNNNQVNRHARSFVDRPSRRRIT